MTRIAAALSTSPEAASAAAEAARDAATELGSAAVDLAFLFLTPEHLDGAAEAAVAVREALAPAHLLGCVAEGVVAGAHELEEGPAAAVWAASLPGSEIEAFHLTAFEEDDAYAIEGLPGLDGVDLVALLADPFTFPADALLGQLVDDAPGLPVVGGIASGAGRRGEQALLVDREIHTYGAAGVSLRGVPVAAIVSQGCMPLGRESVITAAEGNLVLELAGRPALERLQEVVAALPPREQALASRGLLAGLVIDENSPRYDRGDFLMRPILGADEATGALSIGDQVRVGQTLRFHARDADAADEDLELTLAGALASKPGGRPAGALLFTCNGRGTRMFAEPDHDSRALTRALGGPSLAGFFCGGEIGPVGGRNFLHGFTATAALFLSPPDDPGGRHGPGAERSSSTG